ncbi:MAG TPA: sensor histidine kinase [Intrasporangium sp.]|uniref:sensor histidine kinase n=1 Tax=Intrasporangium sp. TaxID=1925024 RepID=UPI002D77A0A6|nr:sensor histidine kinase [Intrasporangium sp.]HET7397546.1 sensor histidine kinase [Intrasporangium sp.]
MNRALPMLAVAALLVMLVEAAPSGSILPAGALGVGFVAWSVAGYRWALGRGRVAAVGYLTVALTLGFVVFSVAGPGVGSTLLLLVVVVQAVMLLPLGWSVVVAVLVPLVHVGMPMVDALRQVISTGLACAFAFVLAALHLREQRARAELAVANGQLRELSAQAEELATMRERTRVARDIHDGLGHHLTVVGMQVQAARAVLSSDPTRADNLLIQAEDQARQALTSVRESVAALREARSAQRLSDQLRTLAAEGSSAGLSASVEVEGSERRLDSDVQEALYRAAQECLTNIHKHANAHAAVLRLAYRPNSVSLEVRDDGGGLGGNGGGFGLVGIRERVDGLGGSLTIESTPGTGVAVWVEVPG